MGIYPWLPHFLLLVEVVMILAAIAHMLRHHRSPGSTIAWLLAFVLLPYVGVAMYLLLGDRKLRRDRRRKPVTKFHASTELPNEQAFYADRMFQNYGLPGATCGNKMELVPDGVTAYQTLIRLIDNASTSIILTTFIFARDEVAKTILQKLTARAASGVDVRILIDGLGSMKTPRRFFRAFENAGGKLAVFKPVIHLPFSYPMNMRNHRKIAIFDGQKVFAGGMNITCEDIHPRRTDLSWEDLGFVVEGPVVSQYDSVCRADWKFATGQDIDSKVSHQYWSSCDELIGNAVVQVLPAGPDVSSDPMYSGSLAAILRARKRLWIATPYFVPNDSLTEALVIACKSDVDVRILVPQKSNHRISDIARSAFLRQIQIAGGQIMFFTKGMIHAKAMIVDDNIAAIGSANFDMRSLFLNYEVMQLCYSAKEVQATADWFKQRMQHCVTDLPKTSVWGELTEGLVRIVSPLF